MCQVCLGDGRIDTSAAEDLENLLSSNKEIADINPKLHEKLFI